MAEQRRQYIAYLLRLWRAKHNGQVEWRASLEEPHTGIRHGFATLDQLVAFLKEQTTSDTRTANPPNNMS